MSALICAADVRYKSIRISPDVSDPHPIFKVRSFMHKATCRSLIYSVDASRMSERMMLIGIDDIHPERAIDGTDCGGDPDKGVLKYLDSLTEFGTITLFVTPNWRYLPLSLPSKGLMRLGFRLQNKGWPEDKWRLDMHPEWCSWLREKVKEGRFELGLHGLYHASNSWPPAAEFKALDENESLHRIEEAERIFSRARLPLSRVFRPPGWGIGEGLLKALLKRNYAISGSVGILSPLAEASICKEAGLTGAKAFYPERIRGVLNIPVNCSIRTSHEDRVREIVGMGGIAVLHGHAENDYHGERIGNGVITAYQNLHSLLAKAKVRTSRFDEVSG